MFDIPQLHAHTTLLPRLPALAKLLPARKGAIAWLREGRGFIAAGQAARFDQAPSQGDTRFTRASQWWNKVLESAEVDDEVRGPATGLLGVGSFSFAGNSPVGSALIIPQVVVGYDGERGWLTVIGPANQDATLSSHAQALVDSALGHSTFQYRGHGAARVLPTDTDAHRNAVVAIKERIGNGEVAKVVLARKLDVQTDGEIDERHIVKRLARTYPHTWTFAVDGLVGATPELLAQTQGRTVRVRVLAGTVPRSGPNAVEKLQSSAKDAIEHKLAVDSVVSELEKVGTVEVGATFVLELPNVFHLATEVRADLHTDATALDVAGILHPTAALGGTPTREALNVIADLEGIDRERYGAPVGWLDARGGQWCVALRCARIHGNRATAFAGGGILADSDPDAEFSETVAKFVPMLDALGVSRAELQE